MAVNLSPVAGAAAQFFDNSGNVLTGGKLYTYDAGTTTPAVTYTTSSGITAHPNPIVLDAAGRVPDSGEIWLSDSVSYKFVLKDTNDVLIGTYDNLIGINSNFINFTGEEETQTATQGQTIFTLANIQYVPATNNLLVFVNGSKQVPITNFVETSSTVVTFVDGLNVGDVVDFCTATPINTTTVTAGQVSFTGFKGQVGSVQDLANNDGSDWIGFQQSDNNAVPMSAQDKMRQVYDIRDYGGAPDNSTNTYNPLLNLRTEEGSGATIKFPYVGGTANIYKFNTTPFTLFNGQTLDVDEGVQLSFPDDSYLYMADIYKVTQPFLSYAVNIQSYAWVSNERNRPITNKYDYLKYCDIDTSTLKPILCNSVELKHVKVLWNTGDTFTSATPSSTSVSGVSWVNPTVNYFNVSLARVQPGDELTAYFDGVVNTQYLTALVRGTGGYSGLYTQPSDTGAGTQQFQKNIGGSGVATNTGYFGKGESAAYSGYRSVWTIRIVTWNTYAILFNGTQVSIGAVNGVITDAGFGTLFTSGTGSCVIQDWTIRRNNSTFGVSTPIGIATFGDSITAERYECWPNYMREALEGGLGVRVPALVNRAVSGADAASQWAVMNSQGIGGASVVVIQIGTNDIQAQTSKSSFIANLQNMYDYCIAAGATPIFGIPPQFYTKGQAGANHGQSSTNYELGAYIRTAVLRFCADNDAKCVDTEQHLGEILANYVNPALTPYWGGGIMNDPMVTDNIHPSVVMEKLLGLAYARAVLGSITTQGNNVAPYTLYSNAVTLPDTVPQNNWAFTTAAPFWYSDNDGNIEFSGVVNKSTGSLADATVIMTLPRNMWPREPKRLVCATDVFSSPCMLYVSETTGNVQIYGANGSVTYVYLDGLAWNIKQA